MEGRKNPETKSGLETRDTQSEVLRRLMVSARNVDGLGAETAKEIFNSENEESRRELIETLSGEQYSQLITGVNGVLRGKEKKDWSMDGVGVTMAGHEVIGKHIFPRHEDKKEIILKSWDAAQRMNAAGRDLEDIGMLLGSMLVETHPFADGNGRTSRLVYQLAKEGFSEEKLKAILSEEGREVFDMALTKVDIDKLFEKKYGRNSSSVNQYGVHGILPDEELPYGKLAFPDQSSPETKESIIEAGRNDERIFTAAILRFLNEHQGLPTDGYFKMYGERKVLLVQKLLSSLTTEQVAELEKVYWEMKKAYTEDMIDIFVNPDKPEYKTQQNDREIRLLDHFKQRLAAGEMLL